jgi:adhesin HecA-like repeat protein
MGLGTSLTLGSFTNSSGIEGAGQITCTGAFNNGSYIDWTTGGLTLTAASLDNTGGLAGDLTVIVAPGGFANLSGSTLTGGAYGGGVQMNVGGGPVTIDAAQINGTMSFWDSATSAYVPIESTLQTVAAGGVLNLGGTDAWGAVTIDGLLGIGGTQTFTQLTIDAGGKAVASQNPASSNRGSTLSGPITDNGTIVDNGDLTLAGPVTGSGSMEIVSVQLTSERFFNGPYYNGNILELGSAASVPVVFDGGWGTLILDDPRNFTGAITLRGGTTVNNNGFGGNGQEGWGDQIVLNGIADSSVTGWSYSGDRTHGTLEIDLNDGTHVDLKLIGDFSAQAFTFAVGPQPLSTDPPSLLITNVGPATPQPDLLRDHFTGGSVSDILTSNTSGAVAIGEVTGEKESYTPLAYLGREWSFEGTGDFLGDGNSGFLIENTAGAVAIGEVSGGKTTFSVAGYIGPEWHIVGTGDFWGAAQGIRVGTIANYVTGGSQDQLLLENTSGQLDIGTVVNGRAVYTQIDQLSSDWKVLGAGAFLGDSKVQFLMENSSGLVEVGDVQQQGYSVVYTRVAALGPEWKYVGSGDVLGDGKDQFLIENTAGVLAAGDIGADGKAHYTILAGLGPEWTIGGVGDYLGEGARAQVAMKNTAGAVEIGDWSDGQIHWSHVGQLGAEWGLHG